MRVPFPPNKHFTDTELVPGEGTMLNEDRPTKTNNLQDLDDEIRYANKQDRLFVFLAEY